MKHLRIVGGIGKDDKRKEKPYRGQIMLERDKVKAVHHIQGVREKGAYSRDDQKRLLDKVFCYVAE